MVDALLWSIIGVSIFVFISLIIMFLRIKTLQAKDTDKDEKDIKKDTKK